MALPAMAAVRAAFAGRQLTSRHRRRWRRCSRRTGRAPDETSWSIARPRGRAVAGAAAPTRSCCCRTRFAPRGSRRQAAHSASAGAIAPSCAALLLTRARAAAARPRPPGRSTTSTLVRAGSGFDATRDALPRDSARPPTTGATGRRRCSRSTASTSGDRIVGFAPGAAYGHAKRWPPTRVAEVDRAADRRRRHVPCSSAPTGDRDAGREIESSLPRGRARRQSDRPDRPAAARRACSRGARRSCPTIRARCTSPRRSACR